MTTVQPKFYYIGILFIAIFVFGYLLSRQGKPYGALLFNAHKLVALGTIGFLGVLVYRRHQIEPLNGYQVNWVIAAIVISMVTIIIGGLLNTDLNLPAAVKATHKIFPYLTLFSNAAVAYTVFFA